MFTNIKSGNPWTVASYAKGQIFGGGRGGARTTHEVQLFGLISS